jgi:site-specific DNA recombinase
MAISDNLRVAIYARVSTEEQREGQTIDSQVAELERFAQEKHWAVVGVYKDEGWSGGVMARPQLDRLRDHAAKAIFQAVILNDVDRLARDVAHLGVIKRDFERKGVQVIFRKLPTDTSPTYNLMVNILGSFAEFERELISDRTRRGRRHRVEVRKQVLTAVPPYGFRYVRKDRASGEEGHLEVAPEETRIVQNMFRWVADEGVSARKVVERLSALRVPSRKGSRRWAASSVLRILHSEVYAGIWYYNKHESFEPASTTRARYRKHLKSALRMRPKEQWIAVELPESMRLVSGEQWQRAQEQLKRNIAFSPRNEKHLYVLKGLVRCAGCMSAFVGDPNHGAFYYRCTRRCKRVPSIREEVLAKVVWQAVEQVILNPTAIIEGLKKLKAAQAQALQNTTLQKDEIDVLIEQLAAEEARMMEAYRKEIISLDQLGGELAKIQETRKSLEHDRKAPSESASAPPATEQMRCIHDYCQAAAERMAAFDDAAKQRFLRLLHIQCIFSGFRVVIKGKLPLRRFNSSKSHDHDSTRREEIVTTEIGCCMHNSVEEPEFETAAEILVTTRIV